MKLLRWSMLAALGLAFLLYLVLIPPSTQPISFPDNKRFAFTIVDDTDVATLENVRPVYRLLEDLGLRTTKTVWVRPGRDLMHAPNRGDSLADPAYLEFIQDLQRRGFEIASPGARGGSSSREEILSAMEEYREHLGDYPKIHVNHFQNRDNLYWGKDRILFPPFRWLYGLVPGRDIFAGEDPASEFYWGDFVKDHVSYVVSFSFDEINLLEVNPVFPYEISDMPSVNHWFSTSDGGDLPSFNRLLRKENLDALEREGGITIVYTHFGKDFYRNGELNPTLVERLRDVASRPGWFVPAGELLDYLRTQQDDVPRPLSQREILRLETLWLIDKLNPL